jgi:TRAP-type C4-dicarboxylate transport system permease small subunit
MKMTSKIFCYLAAMALVDMVIPIPIAALMLIYVLQQKPLWFKEMVLGVYGP